MWTFSKEVKLVRFLTAGGPGPLCQAWSNEARHNGGCNLGRRVVYLQLHGHDEGDVQTLVLRAPSLVCVSSCCFPIRIHGTFIIMNLAQNVLSVLYKCVCVCVCVCLSTYSSMCMWQPFKKKQSLPRFHQCLHVYIIFDAISCSTFPQLPNRVAWKMSRASRATFFAWQGTKSFSFPIGTQRAEASSTSSLAKSNSPT